MKQILILLLFNICYTASAQHNDTQAATYNIVSGAVIGSVGAIINKKTGQKTLNVMAKGAYQGALGGYVTFEEQTPYQEFFKN